MSKIKQGLVKAIAIRFIPHATQRYPTVGDWFFDGRILRVLVSDMKNFEYNLCVAVHEIVEAVLCDRANVKEEEVTAFDIEFEKRRALHLVGPFDEPGDDPQAPYYSQHQVATSVEKTLAKALGLNWEEYDAAVNSL